MITRILYTEIWQDEFFCSLNPNEKLLFIYFLTNDSVNIIHLYRCNLARIKADTGIDTPIILKAQAVFEKAEKMFFKDGFVFLKNAHKFEKYVGEKNEVAKLKLFSRLSKTIKDWYINLSDTPIDTPMDRDYKSEIINPKQETIDLDEIERGIEKMIGKK
jgi:hypothetical protein